ncbi:hypothetical protein ID866_3509 [Astraeus odoratus]|nr:hypothetical protein ID866_3509 [Astraeus odoratus]
MSGRVVHRGLTAAFVDTWLSRRTSPTHFHPHPSSLRGPRNALRSISQSSSKTPGYDSTEQHTLPIEIEVPSSRTRSLTLLLRTAQLLSRSFPLTDSDHHFASPTLWRDLLESTKADLSTVGATPKARIAVCGIDEFAGARDLVTVLLENPFSSDPAYNDILRNRWKNHPSSIVIEYGASVALTNHSDVGRLDSPSTWLLQYSNDIQLVEFPPLNMMLRANAESAKWLLSSDILVILCDPLTTPVTALATQAKHLLNRPNTILAFTSVVQSEYHRGRVSKELFDLGCIPGRILFLNPVQALDAIELLKKGSNLPWAIERYQHDSLCSRISSVAGAIGELLSTTTGSTESSLLSLQTRTTLIQVQSALDASLNSVHCTTERLAELSASFVKLRSQVEDLKKKVENEVLKGSGKEDVVGLALALGAKRMKRMLDALSFWNLVWRVDEVGAIVSATVQRQWCKELEDELILQTGRLSAAQAQLSKCTWDLLATLTPLSSWSSFHSPILLNELRQLESAPSYTLSPTTLTKTLHSRRDQLAQYTTPKLHRDAQSAVLVAFGGILGGSGIGWWLAFGEHLLSLGAGSEIATAVGVGALVGTSSLRWAVGKWERAKRRWLQDLERCELI